LAKKDYQLRPIIQIDLNEFVACMYEGGPLST